MLPIGAFGTGSGVTQRRAGAYLGTGGETSGPATCTTSARWDVESGRPDAASLGQHRPSRTAPQASHGACENDRRRHDDPAVRLTKKGE